jgi:hypothetical protein
VLGQVPRRAGGRECDVVVVNSTMLRSCDLKRNEHHPVSLSLTQANPRRVVKSSAKNASYLLLPTD